MNCTRTLHQALLEFAALQYTANHKGPFIATQLNSIELNWTQLAVQLGQLSSVELCRYKHPLTCFCLYACMYDTSMAVIDMVDKISAAMDSNEFYSLDYSLIYQKHLTL